MRCLFTFPVNAACSTILIPCHRHRAGKGGKNLVGFLDLDMAFTEETFVDTWAAGEVNHYLCYWC